VALSLAEALAAIALLHGSRRAAPWRSARFTSNVDMKSGAPAFGTPEYMRATQMTGQMARFYGLPMRASGVCAANVPDGQAMWETANSLWSAVQSGTNMVYHAAGWLEGGLMRQPREIRHGLRDPAALQRYFEPALTGTTEEDIGIDAIAEVGPGGHFFGCQHTQERYTTAFYQPFLSDWRNFEAWGRRRRLDGGACQPDVQADPGGVRTAADGRGHPRGTGRLRGGARKRAARRRISEVLDKHPNALLEDIGTYLVTDPALEPLRRLLRFGGGTFAEFLVSLEELPDRARLAMPELEMPEITLSCRGRGPLHHRCALAGAGIGPLLLGALRAMADDYGALAIHGTGGDRGWGGTAAHPRSSMRPSTRERRSPWDRCRNECVGFSGWIARDRSARHPRPASADASAAWARPVDPARRADVAEDGRTGPLAGRRPRT
jgi:hypothetical protein